MNDNRIETRYAIKCAKCESVLFVGSAIVSCQQCGHPLADSDILGYGSLDELKKKYGKEGKLK